MLAGAERVNANGGLVLVVLAPIDKYFVSAHRFLHVRDHQFPMFVFKQPGKSIGERLGLVVAGFRVQRNINLHALRAGCFRKALQLEMIEDRAQPQSDLTALNDVGGWAGIEIEYHAPRAFNISRQRKRWVQFNRRQVCHPDQRSQIVRENVVDVSLIALTPNRRSLDPVRAMLGGILLKKWRLVHAIWITLQREGLAR